MEKEERERARELLDQYSRRAEGAEHARNWLIVLCLALAITSGVLFYKWHDAEMNCKVAMAIADYWHQDALHWQQNYFGLLK